MLAFKNGTQVLGYRNFPHGVIFTLFFHTHTNTILALYNYTTSTYKKNLCDRKTRDKGCVLHRQYCSVREYQKSCFHNVV